MKAPASIQIEHTELHAELARAARAPGHVGAAAQAVVRIMERHFQREDEYATPPLALLRHLSRDHVTPAMADVIPLVDRLKAELPLMLKEHRAIEGALQGLAEAAEAEGRPEFARLAERIAHHARQEEEVLYPAAILVGEYVRLKLGL